MKIKNIEIYWLGHASFKIVINGKTIYIDPYKIKNRDEADYILITHGHYDHLSIEDIRKIVRENTTVIATADCQSALMKIENKINIKISMPNALFEFDNFSIECLPAYNTDKHFHPKVHDWVGYLIKTKDLCIYHAGDTDVIPEQEVLKKYKERLIMLLPVGGTYTMNWKEAAELVKKIKPYLAIPMHYGKIVGDKNDALNFVEEMKKVGLNSVILDIEG